MGVTKHVFFSTRTGTMIHTMLRKAEQGGKTAPKAGTDGEEVTVPLWNFASMSCKTYTILH